MKADMVEMLSDIDKMKVGMTEMSSRIDGMQIEITDMKQKQLQTQATLENVVDKCITVLGEGYQLNAERIDKFDLETIKRQSDISYMLAKATSEKVDMMFNKLKETA
jgi:hypothetical protein